MKVLSLKFLFLICSCLVIHSGFRINNSLSFNYIISNDFFEECITIKPPQKRMLNQLQKAPLKPRQHYFI